MYLCLPGAWSRDRFPEKGPKESFGGEEKILYIDWGGVTQVCTSVKTPPIAPLKWVQENRVFQKLTAQKPLCHLFWRKLELWVGDERITLFLAPAAILKLHIKGAPSSPQSENDKAASCNDSNSPNEGSHKRLPELSSPISSCISLGDLMAVLTILPFPTASFHVGSFTKTAKGQESYSELVTMSQWPSFLYFQPLV